MLEDLKLILPEFLLILIILIGQLSELFIKNKILIIRFFLVTLSVLIVYNLKYFAQYIEIFHNNSFMFINQQNIWYKSIILLFSILIIIFYKSYCDIKSVKINIEFITLLLLSVLGMMLLVSTSNFILWFCALELQALTSYVLASFNVNSKISSEAGLKYFILGALMSAVCAFGISFIYGFSGSLIFSVISTKIIATNILNVGLILGVILVLFSILFKLSAVPFHFWTPDIYEGSPIYSLSYFSTIPKFGFLIVLINFLVYFFGTTSVIILQLLKIVSILSMILGSLGALHQKSIKRLLGYSTILNVGYSLIGICCNTTEGDNSALINMLIYIGSIIGLLSCFMAATIKIDTLTFDDLQGLSSSRKALSAVIAIIMFSLIGMPPLAGFFGKYYLFASAIKNKEYLLAIIGIITSLISAFYYLKIIKTLYFMNNISNYEKIPTQRGLLFITILSTSFIMLFSLFKFSV